MVSKVVSRLETVVELQPLVEVNTRARTASMGVAGVDCPSGTLFCAGVMAYWAWRKRVFGPA